MAFQLFIAGQTLGALNVYAETPHAFDENSRTIGLIFAAHSSVAWNSARREEQFRRALSSRDVIGQAKGMIMERYRVDAVQAFELLRKLSQDSNVPLTQVAADLIAKAQASAAHSPK
jgi:AmiR/NasT family two-component response regulator